MKLAQYDYFDVNTKTILSTFDRKNPYLILSNDDVIPDDYNDVTTDIEAIDRIHNTYQIDYLTTTILMNSACAIETINVGGFLNMSSNKKVICEKYLAADNDTIISYYESLGMSNIDAQGNLLLRGTEHAEYNSTSCNERWLHKKGKDGWFKILIKFFGKTESLKIIDACQKYMEKYREYATFGIGYGDTEFGLINFIMNNEGISVSIENYTLLNGSDYTGVKNELLSYYWIL